MQISTQRLILRPYTETDAEALFQAKKASHSELKVWMPWATKPPTFASEIETIAYFRREEEANKQYPLAIFLKDDTYLGSIGYSPRNHEVPEYEIGYWLDTRHTGKGYMVEAVHALTDWLFHGHDAQRVYISGNTKNLRSRAVAESLGYQFEGIMRNENRDNKGNLIDQHLLAHTPESWQAFLATR